jgi:hypothetical protein
MALVHLLPLVKKGRACSRHTEISDVKEEWLENSKRRDQLRNKRHRYDNSVTMSLRETVCADVWGMN